MLELIVLLDCMIRSTGGMLRIRLFLKIIAAVKENEMTVNQLISKYGISAKMADNPNGAVHVYHPNEQGKLELVEKYYIEPNGYKYIDVGNVKNKKNII